MLTGISLAWRISGRRARALRLVWTYGRGNFENWRRWSVWQVVCQVHRVLLNVRPRVKEVRLFASENASRSRRRSAETGKNYWASWIKPDCWAAQCLQKILTTKICSASVWVAVMKRRQYRRLNWNRQKGIDNSWTYLRSLVKENIEELRKIIAKRYRYSDQQKLMQYLARQGFSYDDIKKALKTQRLINFCRFWPRTRLLMNGFSYEFIWWIGVFRLRAR